MHKQLRIAIFFAIALSILLVGCSSKKADGERLNGISEKVNIHFNEKKDDIKEDLSKENLDEIVQLLAAEDVDSLHEENKQLYTNIQEDYQLLSNMFDYNQSIQPFIEEDEQITEEKLNSFKEELEQFKDEDGFYTRQTEQIQLLEKQLEEIKKTNDVEKALNQLFEDDQVKDTVTDEQYEKIKELIEKIDNEEISANFTKQLEKIEDKLKEIEEEKLKEQKLAEEKRLKEEKEAEEKRKKEQQLAEEKRKKEEQEAKKQTQEKTEQEKNNNESKEQKSEEKTEQKSEEKVKQKTEEKTEEKAEQKQEDKQTESAVEATYVDRTIIASKQYPLPANHAPGESAKARAAFNEMAKAAKKDGFSLIAFSTYRSYEYQVDLYNSYVERDGQAAADRYSARPGYSEHQTGLAFDIGDSTMSDVYFEESPVTKWLAEEAYKYGFILRYPKGKEDVTGYMYEPWHYRYVGVDLAKKIFERNTTLEEYFGI